MKAPSMVKVDTWLSKLSSWPHKYADTPVTRESLADLVRGMFRIVQPKIKPSCASTSAAMSSLLHLAEQKTPVHSAAVLVSNLHRLLANWHFIHEGIAVPEWDGKKTPADVLFMGVVRGAGNETGSKHLVLKMKLKTGLGAGIIQYGAIQTSAVYKFLDHESGCSTLECAPEELAGMMARAYVSMHTDGSLSVFSLSASAAHKKHNRKLSEFRLDTMKCATGGMACNACPRTAAECALAVWAEEIKRKD